MPKRISVVIGLFFMLAFMSPRDRKITIWMIGDSTMSIKEDKAWPETGWGVPFTHFFDSSVIVSNHARNGRSTRTFITEGLWEKVISNVKAGDYVFIQFGHNDEVPTKASATQPGEFKANLERYIRESMEKEALPVLFSPVARRKFDGKGNLLDTHEQYAAIVRKVAVEQKVPFIDMDRNSRSLMQRLGPEQSKVLFLWLKPGQHPNYPEGKEDDTHLNHIGARVMANLVDEEMKMRFTELSRHIVEYREPPKKIVVAQDGSGQFATVQHAFNSIPVGNKEPVIIFVKNGVYKEKLVLDSAKTNVTLLGEDKFKTILTWNDHTGKISPAGDTISTRTSQSFLMRADNFTSENISFENNAGMNAGQAVAVQVFGDKAIFNNCRFLGFQDVLYTINPNSRQYYNNCYIEGSTDFIFGAATAWFEKCHIHSRRNSYITAASTPQDHAYGYVFNDCKLTADSAIDKVFLGRPWRPYSSVNFINCFLDKHIVPAGWDNWRNAANEKTARYAEYNSTGPGANPSTRTPWSRQLTTEEKDRITLKNVFGDWYPVIKKVE